MRKLNYEIIKRLLGYGEERVRDRRVTAAEIKLLLYIARICDETGYAQAVNYRSACAYCSISPQSYYNALNSLRDGGFIEYEKSSYYDRDITIKDNDFSRLCSGRARSGRARSGRIRYLQMARHQILREQVFLELKPMEQALALYFMYRLDAALEKGNKRLVYNRNGFYPEYMELLQVTADTLRGYLHSLKAIFSIGVKDGRLYISFKNVAKEEEKNTGSEGTAGGRISRIYDSDREVYAAHIAEAACIRANIHLHPEELDEAAGLVAQYGDQIREKHFDPVKTLISAFRAVRIPHRRRGGPPEEERYNLSAPYLHKEFRAVLGITG